jgi:hypothetical protein
MDVNLLELLIAIHPIHSGTIVNDAVGSFCCVVVNSRSYLDSSNLSFSLLKSLV